MPRADHAHRFAGDLDVGARHALDQRNQGARDDVGNQARAQALDLVLEEQLALLQALQLQPILPRLDHQAADHVVEVMVLDLQRLQALANLGFFLFGGRGVGHAIKHVKPGQTSYPTLIGS